MRTNRVKVKDGTSPDEWGYVTCRWCHGSYPAEQVEEDRRCRTCHSRDGDPTWPLRPREA